VDATHNPIDSPAVQALVRANQRALKTMADNPDVAVKYIASFLDRMTHQEVQRYYERYIHPYYTSDGRVDLDVGRRAVDAVAAELGVASIPADAFYASAL
jgi:ABC-type nitrate/sulfonate/bicarbonate transport system substrate-binding protein